MSDLVPQAAIDAARQAALNCDQGEDIQYAMLAAAAPHIIAAARPAIEREAKRTRYELRRHSPVSPTPRWTA